MRSVSGLLVTAVLVAASPAMAQLAAPGAESAYEREIRPTSVAMSPELVKLRLIQERWIDLGRTLNRQQDELRSLRRLNSDESVRVKGLKEEIRTTEETLAETEAEFKHELTAWHEKIQGPRRILLQSVAVDLKNATLRQAAEALTKATNVRILVDEQVPADTRLTVQARGVTLGAVIEAIGRQADLKISPTDGGVKIGSWPTVEVNGQQQIFKSSLAPWSAEWGPLPGYQGRQGWVFPGEVGAAEAIGLPGFAGGLEGALPNGGFEPLAPPLQAVGKPLPAAPAAGGYPGALNPAFGTPATVPSAPTALPTPATASRSRTSTAPVLSLCSVGDRLLAVAESGRGPSGESGAWITIYRIEGSGLKKIASGFHAVRAAAPAGVPGMPGMRMPAAPSPFFGRAPEAGDPGALPSDVPSANPTVPGGFPRGGAPATPVFPGGGVPPAAGLPGGLGLGGEVSPDPGVPPTPALFGAPRKTVPVRPATKPVPARTPAVKAAPARPLVEVRPTPSRTAPAKK